MAQNHGRVCRTCYQWKRRDSGHGTCWFWTVSLKHAATVETREHDTCQSWQAKVIHVSASHPTPPATSPP